MGGKIAPASKGPGWSSVPVFTEFGIMFVIFTQQMPLMTQFLYFLDISSFCISCLIFPGSEVFINDRGDVKILSFFLAKYR